MLKRELITPSELEAAAWRQGIEGLQRVETCRLEIGGALTFVRGCRPRTNSGAASCWSRLRRCGRVRPRCSSVWKHEQRALIRVHAAFLTRARMMIHRVNASSERRERRRWSVTRRCALDSAVKARGTSRAVHDWKILRLCCFYDDAKVTCCDGAATAGVHPLHLSRAYHRETPV
jgi:hypothetical protein